jgi:hypothetical protein
MDTAMEMEESLFNELTQYVEWERAVQWLALPTDSTLLRGFGVPEQWISALTKPTTIAQRVLALWGNLAQRLPRASAVFAGKASGLAALRTLERGASLVYLFEAGGELVARRGFLPAATLPPIASRFPVDLMAFYEVHDGLVNLMSNDAGPLPCAQWQTLVDPESHAPSLVKVATDGSAAFGFDVSEQPCRAYALWPDEEEVEPVDDPWAFIDDLLASRLEDL